MFLKYHSEVILRVYLVFVPYGIITIMASQAGNEYVFSLLWNLIGISLIIISLIKPIMDFYDDYKELIKDEV
jgi:hypothetical protein